MSRFILCYPPWDDIRDARMNEALSEPTIEMRSLVHQSIHLYSAASKTGTGKEETVNHIREEDQK
jgi:hypothetical protein